MVAIVALTAARHNGHCGHRRTVTPLPLALSGAVACGTRTGNRVAKKTGEFFMPEYVARLCRMQGSKLVPFDTKEFSADNHDEAVRQAVELFLSINTTIDGKTWLQVLCDDSAFFSKEIGQL